MQIAVISKYFAAFCNDEITFKSVETFSTQTPCLKRIFMGKILLEQVNRTHQWAIQRFTEITAWKVSSKLNQSITNEEWKKMSGINEQMWLNAF